MANKRYMHRFSTTVDRLNYEDNPTIYTEPYVSVVEEDRLNVYYNKSGAEVGYLKFTQLGEDGGNISVINPDNLNLEYSFDGKIWISFPESLFLNNGESVLLKGNNTSIYPARFTMTGLVRATGNIMSLLYGDSFREEKVIPSNRCFEGLFQGCTSLTFAPELPATTLTEGCYTGMFSGTSIVNFPTLPALHVPSRSYEVMFGRCTNLRGTGYVHAIDSESDSFFKMFSSADLQGNLTIVRPPNATWSVVFFITYGVNVTSVPDESDKIQVRKLYKTSTNYSSNNTNKVNYYDNVEWFEYFGNHVIDGRRYYLWKVNLPSSERNTIHKYYAITEDRYPECSLENPCRPFGYLTEDGDRDYDNNTTISGRYFVYYDRQNDRLYKESLLYIGPDYNEWFEYINSSTTINGHTYYLWKKVSSSHVEGVNMEEEEPDVWHGYALFETPNPVCDGNNPIISSGYLNIDRQQVYLLSDVPEATKIDEDYFIKFDNREVGWKKWCTAENESSGAYADFFTRDGYSIDYNALNSVFVVQLEGLRNLKITVGYDNLLDINLELLSTVNLAEELVVVGSMESFVLGNVSSLLKLDLGNTSVKTLTVSSCSNLRDIVFPPNVENIQGFSKNSSITSLVLPSTVKYIMQYAFNQSSLRSITLPDGLLGIGNNAFSYCSALSEVTIPSSVNQIGDHAFQHCGNLTKAVINAKIDKLLQNTFTACGNLSQVVLPSTLKEIDPYCFQECTNLTTIDLPGELVTISSYAFSDSGLTSIVIPEKVRDIDSRAFYNCRSLTSVEILSSSLDISSYAFYTCTSLEQINLNNVVSIGEYAFKNCTSLTSIELEKISKIGVEAFSACSALTDISMSSEQSVVTIRSNAFRNCSGLETTYFNCKKASTLFGASSGLTNLNEVIIGPRCSEIPGKFTNFTNLSSVTIQSSLITSFDSYMFLGCTSLTSFEIPSTITSIGLAAFKRSGLEEITIPDTVKSISNYAFDECDNLERVTIGSGLITIGNGVFRNCPSLVYLYFNNANRSFGELGLIGSTVIKEIVLGDLVGTNFITSPDMGLEDYATAVESFTFGAGFSKIRANFFSQCDMLKSVTLGRNMTSIEENAFEGCTSLTSVDIPESVTSIGNSAFHGCTALPSIVIPASVTSIGMYAFSDCIRLKDITSKNPTPPTVADNTFGTGQPDNGYTGRNTYNQNVNKLHVPKGATAYNTAWSRLLVYTWSGFTVEYNG